jgi:hypothetical protein
MPVNFALSSSFSFPLTSSTTIALLRCNRLSYNSFFNLLFLSVLFQQSYDSVAKFEQGTLRIMYMHLQPMLCVEGTRDCGIPVRWIVEHRDTTQSCVVGTRDCGIPVRWIVEHRDTTQQAPETAAYQLVRSWSTLTPPSHALKAPETAACQFVGS